VSGVTVLSIFYVLQCRRSSNKQIHGNGLHCKGLQRLETAFAGKQAVFNIIEGNVHHSRLGVNPLTNS